MNNDNKRICKMCTTVIKGRSDKIFCSVNCKSQYSRQLKKVSYSAMDRINKILHRNRSILLETLGKNKNQMKTFREVLDNKKFNY